ncbi:MAG TPA: hypothetical protein VFR58_15095 [Flavisolibacter sp.]|nr:hypothetical protein [Flavisolibacter sp.]
MDQYNSGIDPEVKRYFKKIIQSFSVGLSWLLIVCTAGLFFRLGLIKEGVRWYNIFFYLLFLASFAWVIRYLYKLWGTRSGE